jgi:hypothetical protein
VTIKLEIRPAQCGLLSQSYFGIVRGPHCDKDKLNTNTSVGRFKVLDPLGGLDLERKGNRE